MLKSALSISHERIFLFSEKLRLRLKLLLLLLLLHIQKPLVGV